MKVLTFSRFFPKSHPRAGDDTFFVEQILNSIFPRPLSVGLDEFPPAARDYINDFMVIDGSRVKHHTIRAGARFSPGETISLRVWSDKPYRSKQIEFAQVEVKKVWKFEIIEDGYFLDGKVLSYDQLKEVAKNDGLEADDFECWFAYHPKKQGSYFTGQIISWSDKIDYV